MLLQIISGILAYELILLVISVINFIIAGGSIKQCFIALNIIFPIIAILLIAILVLIGIANGSIVF